MATKEIEQLKAMADEDLAIDKSALDNEATRTPQIHNKWLKMLYERKDKLLILEETKKELYKKNWLYYNGKADDEVYEEKGQFHLKVLKNDLSIFLESDKEMKLHERKIHKLKNEIDFINKTLEECNRRSFLISSTINFLKFVNGLN